MQLVKPLLVRRLATPTLRINLRTIIREFLKARDLPDDLVLEMNLLIIKRQNKNVAIHALAL